MMVLILTVFFLFVLFPLSDLNDLISSQVSKLTQNRVYFQFDQMHLNPFTVSLGMDQVLVETPQISNLTSDNISISPSIMAAFKRKPGGSFTASGFLKGDVEVNVSPSGEKSKIEIVAQNISLNEARQVAQFPLPLKGQLSLTSQALADLTLAEQPEMEVNLTVMKFELPSTTVSTAMMGSINVPQIQFDKVELKGKLANGKFQIESGKLGSSKDDFYGDIKGEIGLTLLNVQGQVIPQFGHYNVTVDLKANSSFQQRAQLFLSFLDASKSMSGSTAQYKFNLSGDPMAPFQLTPIR
ncbi:MAG: type II secretion system protein GspN [Pseudobdellovibrio sp.]